MDFIAFNLTLHEEKLLKNQPQFSQTMMRRQCIKIKQKSSFQVDGIDKEFACL